MKHRRIQTNGFLITASSIFVVLLSGSTVAQQVRGGGQSMDPDKARVVEYWTNERRASAIPRDFVIDSRGLGYLRKPDGSLQPYGHQIIAENAANSPTPSAKPPGAGGGDSDTTPPSITSMDPAGGAEIGASYTFSATVTDEESGVKSVSFTIRYPDGSTTQSFNASVGTDGTTWSVTLQGFTDGDWSWWVVAKDNAKKGGNTRTSDEVSFTVKTGGGGGGTGGDSDTVANAEWTAGGAVQTVAGRLYFEMPRNAKRNGPWVGYVCSGTAVTDSAGDRSIILTAAHCVYDDENKAFARNVLFIPNQADTTGSGTDLNCDNDPLGCWVPSFGVVDENWAIRTFPDNIQWDYAHYVVTLEGAHAGTGTEESLEVAAGTLAIDFTNPPDHDDGTPGASSADFTYGLGYSYNVDPKFMYCADDMTTEGAVNWWLPSCELSGGSSGGPWVQPMDTVTGSGPLISVNSWGYIGSPGMAGPKLHGTSTSTSSAECVLKMAESTAWFAEPPADGDAGVAVPCP